nr:MAG TPA: hypothetical protein [Caudoviricetes sp.]DAW09560.1 MAG TPA: hypothetical protein [Caudoviricetes sp.]
MQAYIYIYACTLHLKMTCPKMTLLRFANRVRKFIFVNLLPLIWFVWE